MSNFLPIKNKFKKRNRLLHKICVNQARVKSLNAFRNKILEKIATVLKSSRFLKEEDLCLLYQVESEIEGSRSVVADSLQPSGL